MTDTFEIRHEPGNRAGTIPPHWDIFLKGSEDSLITVWQSREAAEYIALSMRAFGKWSAFVSRSKVGEKAQVIS